jgi:CelD/BcsL family acetyltransferase involved in cellulose biosynthesis
MQMMLQRSVSFGSATRIQPRRGTFALEPVEALPRLSERIVRLAERALEPNPFLLPDFLEPAIAGLTKKALRLAIFSDRDDLHFFAPVVVNGGQILGGRKFSVWAHPYAPLGTPLIDRDLAPAVTDALIAHMRTTGRTLFTLPHLPLKGAAAEALRAAAGRNGFWTVAEREMRPILYPASAGGLGAFDRMINQKRRRDLERQLRRLCEAGSVSFMWGRTATEIESAFNMFLQLEASGWKGRRGTALARRKNVQDFARAAVARMAQSGNATIDVLRVGEKPIAALIRLEQGGLSIPWKVAFDEEFAAASPGKQLMCDETRRWLAHATFDRVDPVCEEDNALMAPLWPDREPYGTLIISSRTWGLGARLRAGLIDLKRAGKATAKQLLAGRRRSSKPTTKQRKAPSAAQKPGPRRREGRASTHPADS